MASIPYLFFNFFLRFKLFHVLYKKKRRKLMRYNKIQTSNTEQVGNSFLHTYIYIYIFRFHQYSMIIIKQILAFCYEYVFRNLFYRFQVQLILSASRARTVLSFSIKYKAEIVITPFYNECIE